MAKTFRDILNGMDERGYNASRTTERKTFEDLLNDMKGESYSEEGNTFEGLLNRMRSETYSTDNYSYDYNNTANNQNDYQGAIELVKSKSNVTAGERTKQDYQALPSGAIEDLSGDEYNKSTATKIGQFIIDKTGFRDQKGNVSKVDAYASDKRTKALIEKYGLDEESASYYSKNWDSIVAAKKENDYKEEVNNAVAELSDEEYQLLNTYNRSKEALGYATGLSRKELLKDLEDSKSSLVSLGWTEEDITKYAPYVSRVSNEKYTESLKEENQQLMDNAETPMGKKAVGALLSAESILAGAGGGLSATTATFLSKLTGDYVDVNSNAFMLSNLSKQDQEIVSNEIESNFGKFCYSVIMSIAQSGMTMAVGGSVSSMLGLTGEAAATVAKLVTYPMFSSNAFTSTLIEQKQNGISDKQAVSYAMAAGIAEGLFEELSFDNFLGLLSSDKKTAVKVLSQMIAEGTEEMNTDMANMLADAIINQDYSSINMNVFNYMQDGYSKNEAEVLAAKDAVKEIAIDGLAGAISGGFYGTLAAAKSKLNNTHQKNKAGDTSTNEESTNAETTENELNEDFKAAYDQVANQYDANTAVNATENTAVNNTAENTVANNAVNEEANVNFSNEELVDKASVIPNQTVMNTAIASYEGQNIDNYVSAVNNIYEAAVNNVNEDNVTLFNSIAPEDVETVTANVAQRIISEVKNVNAPVTNIVSETTPVTETVSENTAPNQVNTLEEAKAEDISLTENNKAMVESAAKEMQNENVAKAMVENYDGQPVESYIQAYKTVYDLGRTAVRTNKDASWLLNSALDSYSVRLLGGASKAAEIFYNGKNDAENTAKSRPKKEARTNTKNKSNAEKILSDDNESSLKHTFAFIANEFDLTVNEDTTLLDNPDVYGYYKDGEIGAKADGTNNELQDFFHEVMEKTKEADPEGYNLIVSQVLEYVQSKKGSEYLSKNLEVYQRIYNQMQQGQEIEEIADEFVNNFIAGAFTSEEGIDAFYNWAKSKSETTAKTLLEKIGDFLTNLLNELKAYMRDNSQNMSKASRLGFEATGKEIEAIRNNVLKEWDKINATKMQTINNKKESLYNRSYSLNVDPEKVKQNMKHIPVNIKYLTEDDSLAYINAGNRKKENTKLAWENGKKIVITSREEMIDKICDFVKNYQQITIPYSKVEERMATVINKIDSSIEVNNMFLAIDSNNLYHSFNDHSTPKQENNLPMSIEDFVFLYENINYAQIYGIEKIGTKTKVILLLPHPDGIYIAFELISKTKGVFTVTTDWNLTEEGMLKYLDLLSKRSNVNTLDGFNHKAKPDYITSFVNSIPESERNTIDSQHNNPSFSLNIPVEETKNLIAVHNLYEDKLIKSLQYEGLPMPSIAITKADIGHTNFGEISYVFKKDTIDPKNKKNKVYAADAWTPTFPRIEYEPNFTEIRKVKADLSPYISKVPERYRSNAEAFFSGLEYNLDSYGGVDGVIERAKNDIAIKELYLAQNGEVVEPIKKEIRKEMGTAQITVSKMMIEALGEDNISDIAHKSGKEMIDNYGYIIKKTLVDFLSLDETIDNDLANEIVNDMKGIELVRYVRQARDYYNNNGVEIIQEDDYAGTLKAVNEKINEKDYLEWLKETFKDIVSDQGIRNGKDTFTPSGNRRSFKATHFEVTAENIVKSMIAQNDGEIRNTSGFHGVKSIRAAAVDEFKSIADIKKSSNKLQNLTEEEFEANQDKLANRLSQVMNDIIAASKHGDSWTLIDNLGYSILDVSLNPSVEKVKKELETYAWKVTDIQAQEIVDIINAIKNMPVNMFEAKPLRVVDFKEGTLVIPDDLQQSTIDAINEKGIKYVTYKAGDQEDRKAVVNSMDDFKFSLQIPDYTLPDDYAFTGDTDEEMQAHWDEIEKQEEVIKDFWKQIIDDPDFAALRFTTNNYYGRPVTYILHESTRPGVDYQLSYMDSEAPMGHENYFKTDMDKLYSELTSITLFEENRNVDVLSQDGSMKYSANTDDDFLDEWENILAQKELEEASSIIKKGIKETINVEVDFKDIQIMAKDIKTQYGSRVKVDDIANELYDVFEYMKDNNVNYDSLMQIMSEIARPIIENSKSTTSEDGRTKEWDKFREYLINAKFRLTKGQIKEITSLYGSVEAYRRKLFGVTTVNAEAKTTLDDIWSEIVEASGNTIELDVSDADMPIKLLEAIDGLRPSSTYGYGMNADSAAADLALDIYRRFFIMQARESNNAEFAKLIGELVTKQKQYRRQSYEKYRERLNEQKKLLEAEKKKNIKALAEEIKDIEGLEASIVDNDEITKAYVESLKQKNAEKISQLRQQNLDKIAEIKAKNFDSRKNERDRRTNTTLKEQLRGQVNSLNRMLKSPNTANFIKPTMVRGTIEVLEAINMDTGKSQNLKEKLDQLAQLYNNYKDDQSFKFDYDENTAEMIAELQKMFENRNYTELSNDELKKVIELVTRLKTQIQNASKLLRMEKYRDAVETANEAVKEINASSGSKKNKFTAMLDKYLSYQLNAYRWFRKTSGYKDGAMMALYKSLDNGQMNMIKMQKEVNEMFKPLLEGKENQENVKKLTSTKAEDMVDIGLKKDGKPVLVTRDMMLSYLMHIQNKDNARHIVLGGFTIPNMDLYEKGKFEQAYEDSNIATFFTAQDIKDAVDGVKVNKKNAGFDDGVDAVIRLLQGRAKKLEKSLSSWEQEYLETSKKLFHEYLGEQINKVSVETRGYALAQVKNYFPINTDKHFTQREFAALKQDGSLEGMGFLKERVRASNPIFIEGISNVILRQVDNTSRYVGFSVPVRNSNMLLGIKMGTDSSIELAINRKWGSANTELLRKTLQDVQTGRGREEGLAKFFTALRGNFAAATLTANVGVAMKQAASYPTAAAVLGWDPLGKAFKKVGKEGIAELEAINPLLWYRSKGNSSADISYAKQSGIYKLLDSKAPAVKAVSVDLIQNVDTATVRTLEYASMYYVDENFKDLQKGSDEYWQKVSDIFTKVVEETQPNYTVLQRPEILKDTNSLVRQLFMFKTQPLQNLGIVYDALGEYNSVKGQYAKDSAEYKNAVDKVAKAVSSQLVAALVFSTMTVLSNLAYHKVWKYDQDDDKSMLEEMLAGIASGIASTLSGMLIGGDYLYSAVSELLFNTKNYGIEVSIIEGINDAYGIIKNYVEYGEKLSNAETESERTKYYKKLVANTEDLLVQIGSFIGIPVNNLKNTFASPILYAVDIVNGDKLGSSNLPWDTDTDTQYVMMYGALVSGNMDRYNKLLNELIKAGNSADPEKNAKNKMKSLIKESYAEKEITSEEALELLNRAGIDATDVIDSWDWKNEGHDSDYTKYSRLKEAINNSYESGADRKLIQEEVKKLVDSGVDKGTIKRTITDTYKPIYLENPSAELKNLLITCYMYCGDTQKQALDKINKWQ